MSAVFRHMCEEGKGNTEMDQHSATPENAASSDRRQPSQGCASARSACVCSVLFQFPAAPVCQRGFPETTIQDIAEEADIGLGTLYLYARSKEDLLAAGVRKTCCG
ncbi:MAG: helix-turn-helix domain-containing protein [Gammaproteobacteria bacterium]